MDNYTNLKYEIIKLIPKDTENAINKLIDYSINSSNQENLSELILLQSRWIDNNYYENMNLSDKEYIDRERNKIRKSLIDLCVSIKFSKNR